MFSKVKETATHGIVYGLGQTLSSVVGFLLIPLYTQHLSTSEYGINALLFTSASLVGATLGLGLNSALFRSYYEYDTEAERKVVVSTTFYTLLFSAFVSAILGLAGGSTWSKLIFGEAGFEKYCLFTFLTTGLALLQAIPFAVYRARQLSKRYSIFTLAFLMVRLGLIIYLVAYRQYGVWGIVLGNFLTTLTSTIVLTVTISDFIGWSYSSGEARKLLRFGLPLVVVNLADFVLNSSDRYFLRAFNSLGEVGVYSLGYGFGRVIWALLVQPLGLIWPPMMFSVAKARYATEYYSKMLTYVLAGGVFLWLGVSMLSKDAIMLMAQPDYWSAYQVVPIVGFSYVLYSLQNILNVGIALEARTEYYAVTFIIAAALNLLLNTLLIPAYGMMGAAYATILSFALICVLKYFFAKRFYVVPYEWGRLLKIIAMAVILYWLSNLIQTGTLIVDILLKIILTLSFPFILHFLHFYTEQELSKIQVILKSRLLKMRTAFGVVEGQLSWFRSALRGAKYYALKMLAKVLLPSPTQPLDPKCVDNILIYGNMGIGNIIMVTPTLRAIRQHFPDAHITLLVAQSGCEEVVRGSRLVDEIVKAKPGRWETLKLARQIRSRHFDLLISNFHGVGFNRITTFSGIPYRVGHCTSPGWKSDYDYLYNIKVKMLEDEHEIDRDLHLAEALGIAVTDRKPVFHMTDEARGFAEDFLSQNGICADDLVVGVQVGTWRPQSWKRWDLARLGQVCDQLIEQYQAKVIVLGSSKHQEELETFLGLVKHQPIIALGRANLKQAAAIVEQCDFTICNDSGLMHVSAAVGTPVIAIYGPTDYHRTSPRRYGEEHIVLRKELLCSPCFRMAGEHTVISCQNRLCLDAITVQDVMEAAERMIAGKTGKTRGLQL